MGMQKPRGSWTIS